MTWDLIEAIVLTVIWAINIVLLKENSYFGKILVIICMVILIWTVHEYKTTSEEQVISNEQER